MSSLRRCDLIFGASLVFLLLLLSTSSAAAADWRLNPPSLDGGPDGFSIELAGYLQADLRAFPNWNAQVAEVGGFEIRRARLGLEGGWRARANFEVDFDLKQSEERPRNAWIQYRFAESLALRAGYYKLPMSPEYLTGYPAVDFAERSRIATVLVPGRDIGLMALGTVRKLSYLVGLFAGDTLKNTQRAGTTAAGRLVLRPVSGVELGGSLSRGRVRADENRSGEPLPEPLRKGVLGRNPADYVFFERRFVSGARTRAGLDASYFRGRDSLKAEWMRMWEQRRGQACAELRPTCGDLPTQIGAGWALSATRLLTGERKTRTVMVPRRPVHLGGPGAFEIAMRLERVRFDDDGKSSAPEPRDPRAANIARAGETILAGGMSWWPSRWLRLEANLILERYLDAVTAPEAGRKGDYMTILARLELHIP